MNTGPYSADETRVALTTRLYEDTPAWFRKTRNRQSFNDKRWHLRKRGDTVTPAYPPVIAPPEETRDDWEERWGDLEHADAILDRIAPTIEQVTWTNPDPNLPVGIVFISDIHAGASGVRYDLLRRDMEIVRDTPGLYTIINGDLIENVKPQSKAGAALYTALFPSPREQLAYVQERLKIITGKVIVLAQGNHDAWDGKWAGIDRLPELATELGAAYFTEGGGTVFVDVGGERYTIVTRHNSGGNSRINTSNPMRRMYDEFNQWERADVVCLSHFHFCDMHTPLRNGKPVVWFRSGTYKTRDAYSQSGGFMPEYGCPLVVLYPGERKIIPWRGDQWLDGLRYLAMERDRYHGVA